MRVVAFWLASTVVLGGCLARSPEALVQSADRAGQRGAWREAADLYARAAAQAPPSEQLLIKLGRARYEAGDVAAAADAFRKGLERSPECGPCYAMLGLIAIEDRQFERAMTLLRNALRIDPADVGARNNLGYIHLMARQPAEAYEAYLQASAFDPNDAVANVNLARLCRDYLRDLECARKHFERYLRVHPGGSDAIEIRAWLQTQEDRLWRPEPTPVPVQAQPSVRATKEVTAPETSALYLELAREWESKATKPVELELALKYAQEAASLQRSPEAVELQARLLEKLGRTDEAQRLREGRPAAAVP